MEGDKNQIEEEKTGNKTWRQNIRQHSTHLTEKNKMMGGSGRRIGQKIKYNLTMEKRRLGQQMKENTNRRRVTRREMAIHQMEE